MIHVTLELSDGVTLAVGMNRPSTMVRSLLCFALALLVLVQTVAFAAVPEVPRPATAPPCHEMDDATRSAQIPKPCCDDAASCADNDCDTLCHRTHPVPAEAPELARMTANPVEIGVSFSRIDALLSRMRVPPLPPPIRS